MPRQDEVIVGFEARDSSSLMIGICVPIVSEPHLSGLRSAATSIRSWSMPAYWRIVFPFVDAP